MTDKYMIKQRILELVNIIYSEYNNAGGYLHIVLDDGNIESEIIEWCIKDCISKIEDVKEKEVYLECAELLLKLSYSSRKRLLSRKTQI